MNNYPKLVLRGVGGSHAAGLATPTSDIDTFEVYVNSPQHYLGARPNNDRPTQKIDKGQDVTAYDFRHFVGQLIASNPTALRLLFLDSYEVLEPAAYALVNLRTFFLTKGCIEPFGGMASGQMDRYNRNDDPKFAANAILLLYQARYILMQQTLPIKPNPRTLEMLRNMKAGQFTAHETERKYYMALALYWEASSASILRDCVDRSWASNLCTSCILDTWNNNPEEYVEVLK